MSHLISGAELEGVLIFNLTPQQIVKPRIRRYLLSGTNTLQTFGSQKADQAIMNYVCKRYTQLQKENIEKEKELFIGQQCSALKKRFKAVLNPKNKNVSTFFQERDASLQTKMQQNTMNLRKLGESMPRRIELQRKYNANLNVKMRTIEQVRHVDRMKESYKKWVNDTNRENSPNFKKMNYIIERMEKSKGKKFKTELNKDQEDSSFMRNSQGVKNYIRHSPKYYNNSASKPSVRLSSFL